MKPPKVAYVGSRDYPRFDAVARSLFRLAEWSAREGRGVEVVTGTMAPPLHVRRNRPDGVDEFAVRFARWLGMGLIVHSPDYDAFPEGERWKAPLERNRIIVADADTVAAFWDLKSRGTARTIGHAIAAGKLGRVYGPDGRAMLHAVAVDAALHVVGGR